MNKYVLTTIAGVESIAKKEIEKIGGKIEEVNDRFIIFSGDNEKMINLNLYSRVGNKVYVLFGEKDNVIDFDSLFDYISYLDWNKYIKKGFRIIVKVKSIKSELFAEQTLQKITKKAIVTNLVGNKVDVFEENDSMPKIEVRILLMGDKLRVMIDTSGDALHKRGYRVDTGEAPIKENLAAALVLLSTWRFRDNFYDVFCGSGTIAIEAVMIAKNIAPGLNRKFTFENWGDEYIELKDKLIIEAKKKEYNGEYKIYASDIDKDLLDIAKINAKNAFVYDDIIFQERDFREYREEEMLGTLVSNPPYGLRMKDSDLDNIYSNINKLFIKNKKLGGGIITSYEKNDIIMKGSNYKKRKLYNGSEMCYFYRKK